MDTNRTHGNGANSNPGVEYDRTDLTPKGILIFFIVLGVFAILVHLTALALYAGMTKYAEAHEAYSNPLAPHTYTPRTEILTNTANVNVQQFPVPRLLPHLKGTPGMMTRFLIRESRVLTAAPWQDAQGHVHLPIAMAMKDVLSRLPVRAGGTEIPNYPGVGERYSYRDESGDGLTAPAAGVQTAQIPENDTAQTGGIAAAGK